MNNPEHSILNIAVVGHTNTGKTSLIRTMLRTTEFGDIEDAAGTTRHVEQATISADDSPILNLYDTPGLEDTHALYDRLREMGIVSKSATPVKILAAFTTDISVDDPLEQEAKVIRQVLRSDVLLYIIDVREPFLEKYRIELEILHGRQNRLSQSLILLLGTSKNYHTGGRNWRYIISMRHWSSIQSHLHLKLKSACIKRFKRWQRYITISCNI